MTVRLLLILLKSMIKIENWNISFLKIAFKKIKIVHFVQLIKIVNKLLKIEIVLITLTKDCN